MAILGMPSARDSLKTVVEGKLSKCKVTTNANHMSKIPWLQLIDLFILVLQSICTKTSLHEVY